MKLWRSFIRKYRGWSALLLLLAALIYAGWGLAHTGLAIASQPDGAAIELLSPDGAPVWRTLSSKTSGVLTPARIIGLLPRDYQVRVRLRDWEALYPATVRWRCVAPVHAEVLYPVRIEVMDWEKKPVPDFTLQVDGKPVAGARGRVGGVRRGTPVTVTCPGYTEWRDTVEGDPGAEWRRTVQLAAQDARLVLSVQPTTNYQVILNGNRIGNPVEISIPPGRDCQIVIEAPCFYSASNTLAFLPPGGVTNLKVILRPRFWVPQDYRTIQAAIDAADPGAEIRVASGRYVESLDFRPGLRLLGEGAESVAITPPAGQSALRVSHCLTGTISGFTFEAAGPLAQMGAADVAELLESGIELADCRIRSGPGIGLRVSGGKPDIHDCQVENNGTGIVFGRATTARAAHNNVQGNRGAGIRVEDAGSTPLIASNLCSSNASHGIDIAGEGSGVLSSNVCLQNGGAGIRVSGQGPQVQVERNTCSGNQAGIFLTHRAQGDIIGNDCRGNSTVGILVTGTGTYARIDRNECSSNAPRAGENEPEGTGVGIAVLAGADGEISGNLCLGNAAYGLIAGPRCRVLDNNHLKLNGRANRLLAARECVPVP